MKLKFCVACDSKEDLQHHHLVTRAEGGRNIPSNLITLCYPCHLKLHQRQMNGAYNFVVEDGAIVGRTVESSASINSFLCSLKEFDDFELELDTYIDSVINSGIQIRTKIRPVSENGNPTNRPPEE